MQIMNKSEVLNILLFSEKPSEYFNFLKKTNGLSEYPELFNLAITIQDTKWHPEGNVWDHTMMVIDVAAELRYHYSTEIEAAEFMFGALCHDFGKPYTTLLKNGRIKSPMHDSLGVAPAKTFLEKSGRLDIFPKVASYIIEHLKPTHFYNAKDSISDAAIIRLSERIDLIDLITLCKADHWGRTDEEAISRIYPAGDWLIGRYSRIVSAGS